MLRLKRTRFHIRPGFRLRRHTEFQVWKIAVKNGDAVHGGPVQITRKGGYAAFESADGQELFYTKIKQPGIWGSLPQGGPEHIVWPGPGPDYWSNWAVSKDGIFFLAPKVGAPPEIEFLDMKTAKVSHIAQLSKPSFFGLTVSPDNRALVYSQWDRSERNILLVKNFR